MAGIRGRLGYTILLLHLALLHPAAAQGRPAAAQPVLAWASAGIGAGTQGFAGMVGADLLVGHNLISARAAFVDQLFEDGFWDYAVLYGRSTRGRRGLLAVSAGASLMAGDRCSGLFSPCTPVSTRFGLPLAARAAWHALPFLGVGIYGFANFNSEQSFAGATLTVDLGRLR